MILHLGSNEMDLQLAKQMLAYSIALIINMCCDRQACPKMGVQDTEMFIGEIVGSAILVKIHPES